jgi:DNA-binding NtrC family response regulator
MSSSGIGILVVDDEAADLTVMSQILVFNGFAVFGAGSYEDAVRIFNERGKEISLLVTDVSLPVRNGIELAKELARSKPSLKVLLVSGLTGAFALESQGISPKDRHFLPKPFRSSDLVGRVREMLASEEPVEWLTKSDRREEAGAS